MILSMPITKSVCHPHLDLKMHLLRPFHWYNTERIASFLRGEGGVGNGSASLGMQAFAL